MDEEVDHESDGVRFSQNVVANLVFVCSTIPEYNPGNFVPLV